MKPIPTASAKARKQGRSRWRRAGVALTLGGAVLVVAAGCQLIIQDDVVQCARDGDCTARRGAFTGTRCVRSVCVAAAMNEASVTEDAGASTSPETACLGKVTWPSQSASEKVVVRARFARLLNEDPVVGSIARACSVVDPVCASPTAMATTDAQGKVELEVPRNYRGYIELTQGAGGFSGMVPLMLWLIPPPDRSPDPDAPVEVNRVVSESELNFLLNQAGTSIDVDAGHIATRARNCVGPAAGIALSIAPRAPSVVQYYYGGNGAPTVQTTESDPSGRAGFLNVPPGSVVIEAKIAATGQRIGSYPVVVRRGTFTLFEPSPTP